MAMSDGVFFALAFRSADGSGLVAGVFFAFSACVMAALSRLLPEPGMAAIQAINVVVINPLLMLAFLGIAGMCIGVVVLSVLVWIPSRTWMSIAEAFARRQ
jgi:uncharacterized membrane protein